MTVIGSSDLDVFPLGLGGNTFGWTSDQETSFAVLDAYVAGGGNFIDTADSYSAWVPGNAAASQRRSLASGPRRGGTGTRSSSRPRWTGTRSSAGSRGRTCSRRRTRRFPGSAPITSTSTTCTTTTRTCRSPRRRRRVQRAAEGGEDPLCRALQLHRAPAARVVHGLRHRGIRAPGRTPAALQPRGTGCLRDLARARRRPSSALACSPTTRLRAASSPGSTGARRITRARRGSQALPGT